MRWVRRPRCQSLVLVFFPKEVGDGYAPLFSGKLSHVIPIREHQIPIDPKTPTTEGAAVADAPSSAAAPHAAAAPREIGGRDGPEPTRFGDWELRGRCIDF